MFQFPPSRRLVLWIQTRIPEVDSGGFPHSEIPGSKPAYGSPRLIAVNHVLHRLLVPRHPPYTLFSLTVPLKIVLLCLATFLFDCQRTT